MDNASSDFSGDVWRYWNAALEVETIVGKWCGIEVQLERGGLSFEN